MHLVIKTFLNPVSLPSSFWFYFSPCCFRFKFSFLHRCLPLAFLDLLPSRFYITQRWANGDLRQRGVQWNKSSCLSCRGSQSALIQLLDMAEYTHKEVYSRLSLILDPQNILRDISKRYCKDPVKSMRQQQFHNSHRMMSMSLQAVGNPLCATVTSSFKGEDGRKAVKSTCFLVIMDGCYRRRAIEILR